MSTFDQHYADNYEPVKAFIQRRVKNDSDAADITQDVFMVLHRKMDDARNVQAFLFAVARNKVIDFFRAKRARRDNVNLSAFPADAILCGETERGRDFNRELEIEELGLSPEMRLRIEGYKFSEISGMLSTPEGTLRRRIHSERKTLKRKVQQCR